MALQLVRALAFAAAPLVVSCASVSVRDPIEDAMHQPSRPPARIYVADFQTPPGVFRVDRSGVSLASLERDMTRGLTDKLVTRLSRHVAPATPLAAGATFASQDAWLVTGRFERVNQGSRALRAIIGLGSGGTKMETTVTVYDLNEVPARPFLTFETTGGSNALPGALFSTDPYGAAATLVLASTGSGVSIDATRTARMITAALSDYLARRELNPNGKALRPKQLGSVPIPRL